MTKSEPGKKDFIWFVNIEPTDNPWKRGFISKQLISDASKFRENGFDIGLIQMANPYGLITGKDLSSSKFDIDELFNSVIIGYEGRDIALELMIDAILNGFLDNTYYTKEDFHVHARYSYLQKYHTLNWKT